MIIQISRVVSNFRFGSKWGILSEPRGWASWPICEISNFRSRFWFDIYLKGAPSRFREGAQVDQFVRFQISGLDFGLIYI